MELIIRVLEEDEKIDDLYTDITFTTEGVKNVNYVEMVVSGKRYLVQISELKAISVALEAINKR